MKKIALFTIVAAVVSMMAACGGKTEKVPFDNGDSADVANADPTIYGVCTDGTAMNTLELITDMDDTLSIDTGSHISVISCRVFIAVPSAQTP